MLDDIDLDLSEHDHEPQSVVLLVWTDGTKEMPTFRPTRALSFMKNVVAQCNRDIVHIGIYSSKLSALAEVAAKGL